VHYDRLEPVFSEAFVYVGRSIYQPEEHGLQL
jgi:hypothetical protein